MHDLERAVSQIRFPTEKHRRLVLDLARIFAADPAISAIVLAGSLARERGHPTSDVDLGIVVPTARMAEFFGREPTRESAYRTLGADVIAPEPDGATLGFAGMSAHLWYSDGDIRPQSSGCLRDDAFELVIAALVYGRPLLERDDYLRQARACYLPFYADDLRRERLRRLHEDFDFNLRQVESMAERGLYFHGLERLIVAFRYFVMFLFLTRRRYPIDYLKHVEEQVGEWLARPDLLPRMREVLALSQLDSSTLQEKAALLRRLLDAEEGRKDPPHGG